MAWKWWLLVRGRDATLGLWAAIRAYYLASFAGYFLPMTVGADAVRIGALAGAGRTAVLVASVVLERLVGALAQAVLAVVSVATLVALGLGARVGPAERWGLGWRSRSRSRPSRSRSPAARWVATRLGQARGWRGAAHARRAVRGVRGVDRSALRLLRADAARGWVPGGDPLHGGAGARPGSGLELLHRHRTPRLPGRPPAREPGWARVPGALVRILGGPPRHELDGCLRHRRAGDRALPGGPHSRRGALSHPDGGARPAGAPGALP